MTTKAGVWIDHKQAVIVHLSDAGPEIKKIVFDIGQPIYKTGGGRSKNTFTRNDFVAENKLKQKLASDRKDYYSDVLIALRGASAVLILGPGEAKVELLKLIQSKKIRGVAVESETAAKLTDRQLAAKVGRHFAHANKSKLKKAAVAKTPKAIAGKNVSGKKSAKSASSGIKK